MSFQYKYLPYNETGYFSNLVLDYLGSNKNLGELYAFTPNKEGIKAAIEERSKFPIDRKVLVEALNRQYAGLELSEKLARNISLLGQENTFTVCTAHQPNLLTGYLYFVYKIIHAIKMAEELNEAYPDKHFVPVYYMGSEDNDLEELGTFRFNGDKYIWDGEGQQGAVGRMRTKGLKRMLNELLNLFGPPGKNCDQLKDMLQKAYLQHDTIASATQYLVNELFGQYGLVVVNPDEACFKKGILPILKDELLQETSYDIVTKQVATLSANYKVQATPRKINLFYLADGIRERIEKQGAKWIVINSIIAWTKEELLKELEEHPERFSPNVILRGILQETMLPDVAFIGGGAEVSYWLQLLSLFRHYKVFYPVVFLRQSVLWIEQQQSKQMQQLQFAAKDVFISEEEMIKNYVVKNSDGKWQTEAETAAVEKILLSLKQKATELDVTLSASAQATWVKMKHQLEGLEKKMLRAEKRKMEVQLSRISRLKRSLFPNNGLQERVENFSAYFLQYGHSFFDVVKDGTEPFKPDFLVVEHVV